jgi:hypothetical protein
MKRRIKSYLTFLPDWYRWLVLVAEPLVFVALRLFVSGWLQEVVWFLGTLVLLIVEFWADFGVFCGVLGKQGMPMEYIRSAFDGRSYVMDVFRLDILRRCLWMVVLCSLCGNPLAGLALFALLTLVQNGSRYIESMQLYYLLMCAVVLLSIPLLLLAMAYGTNLWCWLVVAVVAVAAAVILLYHCRRRVELQYFDTERIKS